MESHQASIIEHDNAEAKKRNSELKKSVDNLNGIQLKNSKDIANAVQKMRENQESIMKKEDANQKLIGDENTKIEALETEQDKLEQEYSDLKGDHSHNVKRIEAIKS